MRKMVTAMKNRILAIALKPAANPVNPRT